MLTERRLDGWSGPTTSPAFAKGARIHKMHVRIKMENWEDPDQAVSSEAA